MSGSEIHPYSWKETSPGIFSRPLDTIETFFKWLADLGVPLKREHWGVSMALQLSFPTTISEADIEACLRKAWLILSHQHPMLHARATGNHITVSPLNEQEWLEESFFTHAEESITLDQLFTSIEPGPIVSCHWLSGTHEVVIHGSHWRLDGIGSIKLSDRLLSALSTVLLLGAGLPLEAYGLDLTPLFTPSLDEISLGFINEESTPAAVKNVADKLLGTVIKGAPSIGLPLIPGSEKALPGPSCRVRVVLDEETTKSVVAACKSRALKVTSAVHTAIVQAVAAKPQHPLAKHYCITTAVDLRRRLPEGKNGDGPELAAGMFISPGLVFIEEPAAEDRDFMSIAKDFESTYGADMSTLYSSDDGTKVSITHATAPFARRIVPLLQMPQPEGMPPQNAPHLSSLGILDKYLKREYPIKGGDSGTITVEDFWLGGEMITPAVCCHVWTWRDRLNLAAVYNTAFFDKASVEDFMETVKQNLLKGLAL
ncbi:hypothetical protein BD289DRAFT_442204 [Coniella lustricola]|uniref:Condensation domain-containing protein n=1 Tax=Coniella lustricola TaxID=2025994 RepID=A0A2T2ZYG7_9PEZI|nr:hypothetical protein BD289DRAFT_442204 [Coniella lustricola]